LDKTKRPEGQVMDKIRSSIRNRKPAFLANLLVDNLKESGWTADDIHYLGIEIINESGML
jgi:hypothetical protein